MTAKDKDDSFHSIINSKSEFTFIEESPRHHQLLQAFDIRQSSAIELSSQDLLNKSINHTINKSINLDTINKYINLDTINKSIHLNYNINDISAINLQENNELQCSLCLQNQIDCLSVPTQNQQDVKAFHSTIDRLRQEQNILKVQLEIFQTIISSPGNNQNMVQQIMNTHKFYKKNCIHTNNNTNSRNPFNYGSHQLPRNQTYPSPIQINVLQRTKTKQQEKKGSIQVFNIKPNKNKSIEQIKANMVYKEASFMDSYVAYNDEENEYRVEVSRQRQQLVVNVVNYQRGQTNFMHLAKFNTQPYPEQMAPTIRFPINKYIPKLFALNIHIVLLIFQPNTPKTQQNIVKMQQIRTISIPFPLTYIVQPRFTSRSISKEAFQKMSSRLYIYQIVIGYHVDYAMYKRLRAESWLIGNWLSLRGSDRVLLVWVGEAEEKENEWSVTFRVGSLQKQCQEGMDMIEYLCFMLTI